VLRMVYTLKMTKSAVVHARIEPEIKREAEEVLKELGLSPTDAVRLFYRQICMRRGLPFPVRTPNKTTREALLKSERGEDLDRFDSLEEMFASWDE